MPLPNASIIHPDFTAHHAATILAGMTCTVRLSHPGGMGARDTTTGATPQLLPEAYYEGPGRIQVQSQQTPNDTTSDRRLVTGAYLVAVPVDVGGTPARLDLVDVLDCRDDPLLTGLRLVVVDVPMDSIILQRSLGCDLHQSA